MNRGLFFLVNREILHSPEKRWVSRKNFKKRPCSLATTFPLGWGLEISTEKALLGIASQGGYGSEGTAPKRGQRKLYRKNFKKLFRFVVVLVTKLPVRAYR